jgi:hypothetical protein
LQKGLRKSRRDAYAELPDTWYGWGTSMYGFANADFDAPKPLETLTGSEGPGRTMLLAIAREADI